MNYVSGTSNKHVFYTMNLTRVFLSHTLLDSSLNNVCLSVYRCRYLSLDLVLHRSSLVLIDSLGILHISIGSFLCIYLQVHFFWAKLDFFHMRCNPNKPSVAPTVMVVCIQCSIGRCTKGQHPMHKQYNVLVLQSK